MSKQVKITIVLDQPLHGEYTERVARAILGDPMAYGRYPSFSQDRVTVEEIDTDEKPKVGKIWDVRVPYRTNAEIEAVDRMSLLLTDQIIYREVRPGDMMILCTTNIKAVCSVLDTSFIPYNVVLRKPMQWEASHE